MARKKGELKQMKYALIGSKKMAKGRVQMAGQMGKTKQPRITREKRAKIIANGRTKGQKKNCNWNIKSGEK
jgi:hypothetical protein